ITVRLIDLQAVGGDEYEAFGVSQRFQTIALPADRGSIFDRNGNDLAVSIPQRTIWADPRLIEDPYAVTTALTAELALSPEESAALFTKLSGDAKFTYVERRVSDELADTVAELELPGIFFLDEPKRFTPGGDL